MHTDIVPEQPYTRTDLIAAVDTAHAYLRRACARLGEATNDADVRLAAAFVLSAESEIARWTAQLEATP